MFEDLMRLKIPPVIYICIILALVDCIIHYIFRLVSTVELTRSFTKLVIF